MLLWALIKGLAALLVTGAILALTGTLLPRLLAWWEQREAARLGLESGTPALPVREKTAVPERPLVGPAAPEFPPSPAAAAAAPAPEPLVAAAIALALTLYQESQQQQPAPALAGEAGPSPWTLAGRWLAMERRLTLPKR